MREDPKRLRRASFGNSSTTTDGAVAARGVSSDGAAIAIPERLSSPSVARIRLRRE